MHKLKSKKLIGVVLSLVVLIIIIILTFLLFLQPHFANKKLAETDTLTKDVNQKLEIYGHHFNNYQVEESLRIMNDESLSESERYEATKNLSFYFSTAYSASHEPELRNYAENITIYAQENFSDLYEKELFTIGCADPVCGETPDEEIKQIHKEILDLDIEVEYLDSIIKNLDTAIYIPVNDDRILEKEFGFGLVIQQLQFQNNPEASKAATRLQEYAERKYTFHLDFDEARSIVE